MTFKISEKKKYVFKIYNFLEKKESDLLILDDENYN